jgi:hypothetical protein
MKSTRLASHHLISASRAKSESARKMMRTSGQTARSLRHDPRDLLDRTRRSIDVRRPQLRRQQVITAEDVQRQLAVAVVVTVEEPPLLMPVQRIVSGVEIENDLLGRRLVCATICRHRGFLEPLQKSLRHYDFR